MAAVPEAAAPGQVPPRASSLVTPRHWVGDGTPRRAGKRRTPRGPADEGKRTAWKSSVPAARRPQISVDFIHWDGLRAIPVEGASCPVWLQSTWGDDPYEAGFVGAELELSSAGAVPLALMVGPLDASEGS